MVGDNLKTLYAKLPSAVKLVAVSKFHPVSRLMEAYDAGQRVFGENRPQELAQKVPQMPSDVEWHFIGHLQTNKLKLVLPYVTLVQSVDSLHLLEAIDKWGRENGRVIDVLLELHLGAEETKHGFSEEDILGVISTKAEGRVEKSYIRIRGLMGMATNTEDEGVIEADFARIEALFQRIRAAHPELRDSFTELSIGMSGDWPIAVRHGATMVRIGTDIFGEREY
ncbi:MAG: YggS family pyridoxal phosphate-dependent enzyme [Bacteroidales bacterium]|nr:YggS family pyridoxal phosphate-dependent enzyme [Bacteroidales bacterium]